MEKPKIVSMKDALDMAETESEVPELPGLDRSRESLPPSLPYAPLPSPSLPEFPTDSPDSEHPPEVPPERVRPALQTPIENPQTPPPAVSSPVFSPVEPSQTVVGSSMVETGVESQVEPSFSPDAPMPLVEPAKPPSGAPPWVEREEQTPTVVELAGPVPAYPGVGRPRIQTISQKTVSVEPLTPVTAPTRPTGHWTHHHVHPVHVPSAVHSHEKHAEGPDGVSAPSGKLYERPELDADRFAEEMAKASDATPVQRDVVKEYRDAASRDMLPPSVPPRPLTAEEERARARMLAQQIHQENQQMGFMGKVKRMLGMR